MFNEQAKLQSINYKYEATKSDERAARRSVKLKRQEIDSIQDDINRVKNSISVIDITNRVSICSYDDFYFFQLIAKNENNWHYVQLESNYSLFNGFFSDSAYGTHDRA